MSEEIQEYKVQDILISLIKLDPNNPNIMSKQKMEGLRKFMIKYGYLSPIVVDAFYNMIDGEHRLVIYREFGKTTIPCIVMKNCTTDEDRLIVRDGLNLIGGTYDTKKADLILKQIYEANLLTDYAGYLGEREEDFKKRLEVQFGIGAPRAEDEIPSPPAVPVTNYGDIILLGCHKILCGDSTNTQDVQKLFGDERADQMNTDPPYGVDYANKNVYLNTIGKGNRIETPIKNDDIENYRQFFGSFLDKAPLKDKNTCYIFMGEQEMPRLRDALDDNDYHWSCTLIWEKNNHVLGRTDYAYKHEPIVYCWKGTHIFYAKQFRTTILQYNKPTVNDLHPTMKPVELIKQLIEDGTDYDALVYDPFLGSGSCIIAAEQAKRRCYGIEKSPAYCDVIIARWEKYTGQTAKRL